MTIHNGAPLTAGAIAIGPPRLEELPALSIAADVATPVAHWSRAARDQESVYYFWIYQHQAAVGQILLHDWDRASGASLVAYHLFSPVLRGQGIGTTALRLLQQFVSARLPMRRLMIITSRDNHASQRVAQKCGFVYAGPSREDPDNGMVFEWYIPRGSRSWGPPQ